MPPQTPVKHRRKSAQTLVFFFTLLCVFFSSGRLPCADAAIPSAAPRQYSENVTFSSQPTPGVSDLATVYFYFGLKYYDLGRWQQAIFTLKEALEIKPDCEVTYFILGITYSRLEIWEQALVSFIKAIELKPDYVEAYLGLGITYDMLGWGKKAVKALIKAIQIKPNYAQAHYALALNYLKQGDKKAALEEHGILKSLDPDLANHLIHLINK